MNIEHNLLPKQKRRSYNANVTIDLYPYATALWNELNNLGIIDRMKDVPQLGVIKVNKALEKSRYDYAILQLYFHQIVRKNLKDKLELTYNNGVNSDEFYYQFTYPDNVSKPTLMDLLQLFTIAYNIGHFYNTFVSSRAAVMLAKENESFKNIILNSSICENFRTEANRLLNDENYYRFHLINSLLVLEKCESSFPITLTKQLIYSYLNISALPNKSKLHYVFRLFRAIRDVAYISYDLQIASIPLTLDIVNEKQLTLFFGELLSEYNDKTSMRQFVCAISKMLDDTVYNERINAICYFQISKGIMRQINKIENLRDYDYYESLWKDSNSVFNRNYPQKKPYAQTGILKLTFSVEERTAAMSLLHSLDRLNGTYVGYYDRPSGSRTILVSINKRVTNNDVIAFRVLKKAVASIRTLPNVNPDDLRFLLVVKFFLFHYFKKSPVRIKATIDEKVCVLCTRGKKKRIKAIEDLLLPGLGTSDQRHEVEHLKYCLTLNATNNTALLIPGSIVVYNPENPDRMICEFDGLIIYPTEKEEQILFLEAKNMNESGKAKKCLRAKFNQLKLPYDQNQVQAHGQDVYLYKSI